MYTCPCCGYLTFDSGPGCFDICYVCDWQDDSAQLKWPMRAGGANKMSLVDAQKAFADGHQKATPQDPRDPDWRPFDPALDVAAVPDEHYWDLVVQSFDPSQKPYYWQKG
ncbi:MAG: hydrolase [Rhodospirillaceae bacterium]|nr:hydrolase [Rhodospirillales bacterium]